MAKKIYTWNAPDGYWYTQRSLEIESQRMFWKSYTSKKENAINNLVLWTDAQKAEWEEIWLQEPEGE